MGAHVLHVSHAVNTGLAHCVAGYVGRQLDAGWRVSVACPDGTLADLARAAGAAHEPWSAVRQPGLSMLREAAELRAIIERTRPDVVHLHCAKAGLLGRLVLRGRRPTVFNPHAWSFFAVEGARHALVLRWERWAARWADAIVCVSQAEAEIGREHGVRGRLVVLPNQVGAEDVAEAAAEDRAAARARLGVAPHVPLAVCTARLIEQKGQDVLVGCWPQVRAAVPEATVVLVGDGPDRERLEAAAARTPGVRLVGAVNRRSALRWMRAADVVACPSRWEGMSLVPLEAMALGRPLVVTDVPGMTEAVPADAAWIVPPNDPEALQRALVDVLGDVERAEKAGEAAREQAARSALAPRSTDRLNALYDALLDRTPAEQPQFA